MRGFPPNQELWAKVNAVLLDENMADVTSTLISGMCALLVHAGVVTGEKQARAHLAAMLVSPDDAPPGSLVQMMHAEIVKLDDGKWRQ